MDKTKRKKKYVKKGVTHTRKDYLKALIQRVLTRGDIRWNVQKIDVLGHAFPSTCWDLPIKQLVETTQDLVSRQVMTGHVLVVWCCTNVSYKMDSKVSCLLQCTHCHNVSQIFLLLSLLTPQLFYYMNNTFIRVKGTIEIKQRALMAVYSTLLQLVGRTLN